MRKLLSFLYSYIFMLIGLVALVYGQTTANLALPDYMATIINKGIIPQDIGEVYAVGGQMLLVALLGGLATVGVGFLAARIATGFARKVRDAVFVKTESFSQAEFNKFSTASLITRSTNDIQQIQQVTVMLLRIGLIAPFMGVGAVIKAYQLAPSMTWIMTVSVMALITIIVTLFAVALPKFKQLQTQVDRLNKATREILTGLRVIRAFNQEEHEERRFEVTNRRLTDLNLSVNRLMVVLQPAMTLIMSLSALLIVWVGAYKVDAGSLQIGDMLAFMQYAMQTIFSFLMLSIIFIFVPRAWVSVDRVIEVLNTEPIIRDPETPQPAVDGQNGRVDFVDVTFGYAGAETPALAGISFTALPGETTAIVGSTGSGKSTLVSLIPRFYDVTSGHVMVDNQDVRDIRLADLHDKIGYAPQRGVLFSGTVASNVRYGAPKIGEAETARAVKVAQAEEFVSQLDKGLEHQIAQGGGNVSGGQKQRLSIARALAKKPEIYIFDDSFSALDFKTDALLRQALEAETKGKTVLIVAQRIGTIMDAAKIVVLDSGKVVGQGTHAELLRDCRVYREIAESQLSEAELNRVADDQKKEAK
jgi:ATP-binding cassette subfamily B protein